MSIILKQNIDLNKPNEMEIDKVVEFWVSVTGVNLTEAQSKEIPLYLAKFGLNEILEAMRIACDQYVVFNNGSDALVKSADEAFVKIRGILEINGKAINDPHIKSMLYIRGILRKRKMYINEKNIMEMLRSALELDISKELLIKIARQETNWTEFQRTVLNLVQERKKTNISLDTCEMKVMLCITEKGIGLVGEIPYQNILDEMSCVGLRKAAVDVGLEGLLRKGLIDCENPYGYSLTSVGRDWLVENQALLL